MTQSVQRLRKIKKGPEKLSKTAGFVSPSLGTNHFNTLEFDVSDSGETRNGLFIAKRELSSEITCDSNMKQFKYLSILVLNIQTKRNGLSVYFVAAYFHHGCDGFPDRFPPKTSQNVVSLVRHNQGGSVNCEDGAR